MKRAAVAALAVLVAALIVAGCGGGSESSSSSTAPSGGTNEGGAPKQATSPNAPAGSKVVACRDPGAETQQLRATEVDCDTARETAWDWGSSRACTRENVSRSSCSFGDFRCQAVRVDRGFAVSCAGPEGVVAWIAGAPLLKKSGG
jgi:hypothetical protein